MHNPDLTTLSSLIKKETNARMRIRLLAIAHFKEGMSRTDIAIALKVSCTSVNKWVTSFLSKGLDGLAHQPGAGRRPKLTEEQRQELARYVELRSQSESGGRLTGREVQQYILDRFHHQFEHSYVYQLLKQLGFSWITSRSRHPKQSQAAQDEFKKTAT